MKRIMISAAMILCIVTLCLTSYSKDDSNENVGGEEKELAKKQFLEACIKVLDSIPGGYEGLISADAKNQGLSGNIKWSINEDDIVVCKNFPYEVPTFGISTNDNSGEVAHLRSALKEAPLANPQFRLIGNPGSKDPADLYAIPRITTKIQTSRGTYNVVGQLRNDRLNTYHDTKSSSLDTKSIIYRLDKIVEHQDGRTEYKQGKKLSIPVEFELGTIEEKEIR